MSYKVEIAPTARDETEGERTIMTVNAKRQAASIR
jgi:hypothetical protein